MSSNLTRIITEKNLTFMNGAQMFMVGRDNPKFDKLIALIKKGVLNEDGVTYRAATGDDLQAVLEEEQRAVEAALHAVDLSETLSIKDGLLCYKDRTLDNYVARKLIESVKEGFIKDNPLVAFIDNLMRNPSMRAVQQLYPFLEVGATPLTPEGKFVAFKAIRANWTDIHTGTFDNSIGVTVEVNRNEVDEDPDKTCSHGLHVCSYEYLPHFAHDNGHVIIVEVDPADVVAIPRDYNNTKMRVCRYKVIAEYKGYYQNEGNILSNASVFTGNPFGVRFRKNETEEFTVHDSYVSLSAAAREYDDLCEKYYEVQIFNTSTEDIIDEHQDSALRVAPAGQGNGTSIQLHDSEDDWEFVVKSFNSLEDYEDGDAAETQGFDDEDEARDYAKDQLDDYPIVEIKDDDGEVIKTYGYNG